MGKPWETTGKSCETNIETIRKPQKNHRKPMGNHGEEEIRMLKKNRLRKKKMGEILAFTGMIQGFRQVHRERSGFKIQHTDRRETVFPSLRKDWVRYTQITQGKTCVNVHHACGLNILNHVKPQGCFAKPWKCPNG